MKHELFTRVALNTDLPEHGLQLLVMDAGDEVARFVLIGDPAARIPVDDRIVAVALADQVGRAIALASAQEIRKLVEQGLSPR